MQDTREEYLLNPFPLYKMMRETDPIHSIAEYRAWQVFRYDDVQRVLSHYAAFSSNFTQGQAQDPLSTSLISMDPPRHRQMRNIVTQAFTPRSVARLSERITAIVTDLLDPIVSKGQMDIIDDLSYPLPVIVIAEMLGIPQQDRESFKLWSDAIVGTSGAVQGDPQRAMGAYFMDMIERRRREPQDDLISALLDAQIDGQHLNQRELLGFCMLLLVAGNETTTNLIGNALLCFDEQPEVMEQLRADPELMPNAIEEVLRYRSPVQMMYRRAVSDVTLDGRQIRAGQMVLAQIGSANRDEAQFPNADTFDIRRAPNRHIAFGHGIHFCLGAPLARLEARIVLNALLARVRAIHRVRAQPLEPTGSDIVYGVKHLPITFTAA